MDKTPILVLFIDDDGSLQHLASALLNNHVFRVVAARDTQEADAMLLKYPIELIICDVMMPGEDGISYCTRLKKEGNKIPIMILSAVGAPKSIQRGLDAGAHQYLVKPFDIYELQKQMLAMLGRKLVSAVPHKPQGNAKITKFISWLRE